MDPGARLAVAGAAGPCAGCGADDWQAVRPPVLAATRRWLASGGSWRPYSAVCSRCGQDAGRSGVLFATDDQWRPLPLRLAQAVMRTVRWQRTSEPAPWLYVAATGVGALVGATAARATASGPLRTGAAAGAAAGVTTAYGVFAGTALRHRSTWRAVRLAALDEVAPERSRQERRDRAARFWAGVELPAWGVRDVPGERRVSGTTRGGTADHPEVAESVALTHGHPEAGPCVEVETLPRDTTVVEPDLADELAAAADADQDDPEDDLLTRVAEASRARAARAAAENEPQWQDRMLVVDDRAVPARQLAAGQRWVAHAELPEAHVVVRAWRLQLWQVALERADLRSYEPW